MKLAVGICGASGAMLGLKFVSKIWARDDLEIFLVIILLFICEMIIKK